VAGRTIDEGSGDLDAAADDHVDTEEPSIDESTADDDAENPSIDEPAPRAPIIAVPVPSNGALSHLPTDGGRSYRDPAGAYLASLSTDKGRSTAIEGMRRIARALKLGGDDDTECWRRIPWRELTYAETNLIRAALIRRYRPETVRVTLTALKGVLHEAYRLGLIDAERYERARDIKKIRGKSAESGRAMQPDEWDRVQEGLLLRDPFYAKLVRAIFAVGVGAGLRRAEIATLKLEAIDKEFQTLRFWGKGVKERIQELQPWARPHLRAWIRAREERSLKASTAFLYVMRSGAVIDAGLTPKQVWSIVVGECSDAGIEKITPHDFRRTYISRLLDTTDLATVSQLAGHAKGSTTTLYDRRSEDVRRKASDNIPALGHGLRAVAYIRTSARDQTLEQNVQRGSIAAWAKANGVAVVSWHSDLAVNWYAAIDERPALRLAIEDMRKNGVRLLLVEQRDRISRDADAARAIDEALSPFGGRVVTSGRDSVVLAKAIDKALSRSVLPFKDDERVRVRVVVQDLLDGESEEIALITDAVIHGRVGVRVASIPHCLEGAWQKDVETREREFGAETAQEKLAALAAVFVDSMKRSAVSVHVERAPTEVFLQAIRDGDEVLVVAARPNVALPKQEDGDVARLAFLFRRLRRH
jgi:integrase